MSINAQNTTTNKNRMIALPLSMMLGFFGADRFYLGVESRVIISPVEAGHCSEPGM